MLLLDPEFFAAYTQFSSVPWVSGTLEPKVKELIYTAFDVSATHLYASGLRQHIRNALDYGATREEVLEVIELASVIGIHSCTVGVPILVEELAARRSNGSMTAAAAHAGSRTGAAGRSTLAPRALALATAAALMLESGLGELASEADRLLEDCARRPQDRASMLEPQLGACVDAARDLRRLLVEPLLAARRLDAVLDQARASHRRLRREVWRVLPCEYVPCCASGHAHAER